MAAVSRSPGSTLALALCAFLLQPAATLANGCGQPATPISRIQGSGHSSPLTGETVTVEAILTLDARTDGGFGGFYLQQADHQTDGNPLTSEALFVYTRNHRGQKGDRLRVTGKVREHYGLTELASVSSITLCGQETLPEPVTLSLPWSRPPESLENMRVRFRQKLTVIDIDNLELFGELTLAATDQIIPTEYLAPGPEAEKQSQHNLRHRILLDDGLSRKYPRTRPWLDPDGRRKPVARAGDTMTGIAGILDFRFDRWRLQPETPPRIVSANPRPPAPGRPPGHHIRVMAMNLGNYFNGDGTGKGFPTSRGARTLSEYQRQQQHLLSALQAPDPDILALTEVENDGYGDHSSVTMLARALGPQWRVVASPGADGRDEIRTTMLYRQDRVQLSGAPQRLQSGMFLNSGRPPLAQRFRRNGGQQTVQLVSLHLKSKSCGRASGADTDRQDGQGCYADRRSRAARAITDWVASLPTAPDLAGTLITGDVNSYSRELPLQIFASAGFTDMLPRFHPCRPGACPHYSYRYQGQKGSLDHALASDSLEPLILNTQTWLINADEPQQASVDSTGPWGSSDHNPVITDIRL